ncbi:MAG: hypothetical protein IJ408_04250 [Clostridia bacterium]|nr:hypothetical protein [Clostridia bacterium]
MSTKFIKASVILFLAEVVIIFLSVFYLFADFLIFSERTYDYFTYSEWQTENGQDRISVHEKQEVIKEQIFYAEANVKGVELIANFDMNANTVTFYESGKSEEYAFGFVDFSKNSLTIEIKRTKNQALKEDLSFFRNENY